MWFLIADAAAATIYVGAGDTLQDAVDAAVDGDTIQIDAITLTDAPGQITKKVTIIGAGVGNTVLDLPNPSGSNPALALTVDVTFQDLTLDGSTGTSLLQVKSKAKLTLTRVTLQNADDGSANGGGVRADSQTSIAATDVTFQDNTVNEGGGIFLDGTATLDCLRCTFLRNHGTGGNGDGGAIWMKDGTATLTDSVFTANQSDHWFGGAISATSSGAVIHVIGATFGGNLAAERGGAIAMRDGGVLTVVPSLVGPPVFDQNGAQRDGGAIACDTGASCSVTITGASFTGNTSGGHGGALYVEEGGAEIADSTFAGGSADGNGGGVAVDGGSLEATRTVWCDNLSGGSGGALYAQIPVTVSNLAALRNVAGGLGGAVDLASGALVFSTLVDNQAGTASAVYADGALGMGAVVVVDGAVEGDATLTAAASWNAVYSGSVTVVSSILLTEDPFALSPTFCGYPIPAWQGELVDQVPDYTDPDHTVADLGATGGPNADPALWVDADGDGVVVMWDCDDDDPTSLGPDPECVPVVTTPVHTDPTATAPDPTTSPSATPEADRAPGAITDATVVGCGCGSPGAPAGWALVGLLLAATSRRGSASSPRRTPPGR